LDALVLEDECMDDELAEFPKTGATLDKALAASSASGAFCSPSFG
jgi:hypothetical protein